MTTIDRGPTPPGPVTELFEQLDRLHLAAGRPSMREIAARVGRGRISSSTVHNVFRRARVPRWSFLEEIVRALNGDTAAFAVLWQAAWQAQRQPETHRAAGIPGSGSAQAAPTGTGPTQAIVSGRYQRIWSAEIPAPNPLFTGRETELQALRANLVRRDRPHPAAQVISGPGGVGKTEIAAEYLHRHRDDYEIIWWIRAEHHDRVGDALIRLGQRLELRSAASAGGRAGAIAAVLEALESGVRPSWLLVYDNATQPLELNRYLPRPPPSGHIVITSRVQNWPGYMGADGVEVSPFSQHEAIGFLRCRVPTLGADDDHGAQDGERGSREDDERRGREAQRLAVALDLLPIAVEHAAAYLAETGQSVDEYLTLFGQHAKRLSEQLPDFPASVSGTWAVSSALLTADAEHLANLCAFFSPEPIAAELFLQYAEAVDDPAGLRDFLRSARRFRAAVGQLHRLSLVKIDGARDQIRMPRAVQAITRGQLRQNRGEVFQAYQAAVDTLLAESSPGDPDHPGSEMAYELSWPHIRSERNFLYTANAALRRLVIDQVRRLHLGGGQVEAVQFGQDALKVWRERLGHDDLHVLTLAVEVATAMRVLGSAAEARELSRETLRLLTEHYGQEHEITLLCASLHGTDLRARAQFGEAFELDLDLLPRFERVYGPDHERTLGVLAGLASDYRRLGRLHEALQVEQRICADRRRVLGDNAPITLISQNVMAFDLRSLGRYAESLDIARTVVRTFATMGGPENPGYLNARIGFAAALRKAGHHWDALRESEDVVQRCREYLGADHMYTLRAAINLVNDRRAVGDLAAALELGREVRDRYLQAALPVDFGYTALVSLASVLRVSGQPEGARRYDLQAREGLVDSYGDAHPLTLLVGVNYVSDLAACGDLAAAIRLGRDTLARCRTTLGEDHPDTLIAASNLALDEAAAGNQVRADRLLTDALRRYAQTLTAEHPQALAAARRSRLTAEIEPLPARTRGRGAAFSGRLTPRGWPGETGPV
ncbi:MAG: FxSxx-COOH system tetratricopeptide repeat protein [Streptosporangiaceae bacterium]